MLRAKTWTRGQDAGWPTPASIQTSALLSCHMTADPDTKFPGTPMTILAPRRDKSSTSSSIWKLLVRILIGPVWITYRPRSVSCDTGVGFCCCFYIPTIKGDLKKDGQHLQKDSLRSREGFWQSSIRGVSNHQVYSQKSLVRVLKKKRS